MKPKVTEKRGIGGSVLLQGETIIGYYCSTCNRGGRPVIRGKKVYCSCSHLIIELETEQS